MWREVLYKQANPMLPGMRNRNMVRQGMNRSKKGQMNKVIQNRLAGRAPLERAGTSAAKAGGGFMKKLKGMMFNRYTAGLAGLGAVGAGGYALYRTGQPRQGVQQHLPTLRGQPY